MQEGARKSRPYGIAEISSLFLLFLCWTKKKKKLKKLVFENKYWCAVWFRFKSAPFKIGEKRRFKNFGSTRFQIIQVWKVHLKYRKLWNCWADCLTLNILYLKIEKSYYGQYSWLQIDKSSETFTQRLYCKAHNLRHWTYSSQYFSLFSSRQWW